jgi:hypothetical protein
MSRVLRTAPWSRFRTWAVTSVPAPVVVEVYAPQPSTQELSVLLAACSRAATPHECIDSDSKGAEPPLGVAIVRRDGDRARIELGLRSIVSAQWSTRDLVFQPGDDELERYRAIGFAIGTLVARESEPPSPVPPTPAAALAPAASPSTPPRPPQVPERVAAPAPHRPRAAWVDAAGSVGLGLIPGPPRAGGSLRAAFELVPSGVFAVVEGAYAERSGDPSLRVRWLSAALGVGHPLAPNLRSLGVDVRLMFVVERMSLTAFGSSYADDAARWRPGVTAAIDGHWDVAPPVGLVISAATFIDPEHTVVNVGGESVGETPALGLSGFLGVRFKLR